MKTETTPKAETESRTRIQAYSKSQLAGLYLPHIQSASARRTLRSWIAKNTALQAALAQTDIVKSHPAHSAQVRLFFKFLESPETTLLTREISSDKDKAKQGKKKGKPKQSGHFITDHANQIITC